MHNIFLLIFAIKLFIIKVAVKDSSFAWNLQRNESLQCWKFRDFIFQILCNILITSAKKREKVIIAVTSSNFILLSLFGCTKRIYFMLFLFSNLLLNSWKFTVGHPFICHLIQTWIRLKKLYFLGNWQKF